jgi:hypothetical protein
MERPMKTARNDGFWLTAPAGSDSRYCFSPLTKKSAAGNQDALFVFTQFFLSRSTCQPDCTLAFCQTGPVSHLLHYCDAIK